MLAVLDLSAAELAFAAQPEAMLIGTCPCLAAPAEGAGVAEAAFELIEQCVVEDVLVVDWRPEWRGGGRRGVGHSMAHLRLRPAGEADGDRERNQRDAPPVHDTSTVRNIPISM